MLSHSNTQSLCYGADNTRSSALKYQYNYDPNITLYTDDHSKGTKNREQSRKDEHKITDVLERLNLVVPIKLVK